MKLHERLKELGPRVVLRPNVYIDGISYVAIEFRELTTIYAGACKPCVCNDPNCRLETESPNSPECKGYTGDYKKKIQSMLDEGLGGRFLYFQEGTQYPSYVYEMSIYD